MATIVTRPRSTARAGWFVAWAWLLSLAFFGPLFYAITNQQPFWLFISCASGMAGLMLVDRKVAHDRLSVVRREYTTDAVPRPEQVASIRPVVVSRGGSTIKLGSFRLTYEQAEKLAASVLNSERIVRDRIPPGVFTSLSRRWPEIVREFRRLGFIDSDQRLTATGRDWFARFVPPTLLTANGSSNGTGRTTTATTGDAAQEWLDNR